MNAVEKLLSLNLEEDKRTKDVTLHLKKFKGEAVTFTAQALTYSQAVAIQDGSIDVVMVNGKSTMKLNTARKNLDILQAGYPDIFGGAGRNLWERFGADTVRGFIDKVFTAGEVDKLVEEVESISDFNKDNEEDEVKN